MADKHRLVFVCFPETHLLDMTGPAHVFYEAIEHGVDYELQFITTDTNEVRSTSGLHFSQLEKVDIQNAAKVSFKGYT